MESNDSISREEAIDAQEAYMADHQLDGYEDGLAMINILRNLPSTQPEQKKGEWIEIPDDVFAPIVVCSRCGQTAIVSYGEYQRTRYCPYCGIKMKNGGDEKR